MTPWTATYQAPLSMGFSRQEYWSGVPLPSPHTCRHTYIHTLIHTDTHSWTPTQTHRCTHTDTQMGKDQIWGSLSSSAEALYQNECCLSRPSVSAQALQHPRATRGGGLQGKIEAGHCMQCHLWAWWHCSPGGVVTEASCHWNSRGGRKGALCVMKVESVWGARNPRNSQQRPGDSG